MRGSEKVVEERDKWQVSRRDAAYLTRFVHSVGKPNYTPCQPPCAAALNSLYGSSRVFFDFGKKSTQKTDSLFLGSGKKVSKKTVPLVQLHESSSPWEEQVCS